MRWIGVPALVVALVGFGAAGSVAAGEPVAATCPGQSAPPPPAAAAEEPGAAPLPVPAEPVGDVTACGDRVAGGAAVPAGVTAAAFLVADLDSGDVLAVRAPHARHRPASTIKVLTALVALHGLEPDQLVEGTPADLAIEGSRAGIGPGGQYTVRELLAGMLLDSGNDAAGALARELGGDRAAVEEMADVAADLGALDTRPVTPSGLDGTGSATSAYDLALLFREALDEPLFAELIATGSLPFPGYGDRPGFVLSNSSRFLARYPGALGGKTGYTEAARHTFVGAAERGGRRLVVAVLRAEQQPVPVLDQITALLDLGFALPVDAEPLGELVDGAPATPEPTDAPLAAPPSAPLPDPAAPAGPDPGSTALLVGGGLLAATVVIGIAARPRGRGRHR